MLLEVAELEHAIHFLFGPASRLLEPGRRDPRYERPLEDRKQHERGKHGHHDSCHNEVPGGALSGSAATYKIHE